VIIRFSINFNQAKLIKIIIFKAKILQIMVKKSAFLLVLLFGIRIFVFSQVVDDDTVQETLELTEDLREYTNDEFYFSLEPAYSFREVMNNPIYLTGNAEDYAQEESIFITSYTLGLRKELSKHLFFDIAIGFARNGERYEFESADSLYAYENRNRHISFPIHLAYTYGENFSLYTGLGLTPKAFLSQKQDLRYSTSFSSFIEEEEVISKEGFNLFVVDASFFLGAKVRLGENAGLHFLALGGYQLNNTYDSMSTIIRKAYRVGGAIGLYFNLQ
jgi:hypothetical protein